MRIHFFRHYNINCAKGHVFMKFIYRLFDVTFSTLLLIAFFPVFIGIYFIRIFTVRGLPVFFVQDRLGLDGKIFRIYKFRTMIINAEEVLEDCLCSDPKLQKQYSVYKKLDNDPRVDSRLSAFLRRTNFDEIPQFINVLKNEMSVVGPRPYIKEELDGYPTNIRKKITSLKPGITGIWQVSKHINSTFEERVNLDLEYIENKNLTLDIKIFLKTFIIVLGKILHF